MYILCLCLLLEYDIRLKILSRKKRKNHENSLLGNLKLQNKNQKNSLLGNIMCQKKREIQYYAMIRMGRGV